MRSILTAPSLFFMGVCLLFASCQSPESQHPSWQNILGRDEGETSPSREAIYRARVPSSWIPIDVDVNQSIMDTTRALIEYQIQENEGTVHIAVHNFPADDIEQRIPPSAQLARWKRQLGLSDILTYTVTPCAHGGFVGLCLAGSQEEDGILAWAMQLDSKHFKSLHNAQTPSEHKRYRQMRGDYTLKVTGPQKLISLHQNAIEAWARSFELLEEIPTL